MAATAAFRLQLFHVADQEPRPGAVDDIPNFSAVLNALRTQDVGADGDLFLSSGDAIIPGLFLEASQAVYGAPGVADILIQNALGVQAISFGNHEWDKGAGLVRTLITGEGVDGFDGTAFPYLSGNIDVTTDANLADLTAPDGAAPQPGKISGSTVFEVGGQRIGVVSATTPTLGSISSPGDVTIEDPFSGTPTEADLDKLAANIQRDVDALLDANPGMNKVILLAHMQQISIETALASRLKNIDIIVAGGSNTRLLDEDDRLRDGDVKQGQYPTFLKDADDKPVALVNTDGSYQYLGRLVIDFDENGDIVPESYDPTVSGAYATDDAGVAAVGGEGMADPVIQEIADKIRDEIVRTDGNYFGKTAVFLNGNRSGGETDGVRTQETNLGDLTADANLWTAKTSDSEVVVSIKNGGGVRASIGETVVQPGATEYTRLAPSANPLSGRPEGGVSENAIKGALAFNNGLTLLTLTTAELAAVLEHGVSGLPGVAGRFPQVSGLKFSFDPDAPAGDRVQNAGVFDENGALIARIIEDGEVVDNGAQTFRVVTLSFLAGPRFDDDGNFTGGGDGYPFPNTNTDPAKGALGDAAVIARVNIQQLEQSGDAARSGEATFAADGSEQDSLAEYLFANHTEKAFMQVDTPRSEDMRIQNLNFRADAVFQPVINEFVFNHTSRDTNEFVEVKAGAKADLSDYWLVQIDGDGSAAGRVNSAQQLGEADEDGVWWTGFQNNVYQNGASTLLLVKSFTGARGDDLDADNDGALDSTPWGEVVDGVAVRDGAASDKTYADTVLERGFDGNRFTVGGASRLPDGSGDWTRNDFGVKPGDDANPDSDDAPNTPGALNADGGQSGGGEMVKTIMEIQGSGLASTLDGARVETGGVVTALTRNGFYMQDPQGDGDDNTSDAIYVFTGSAPTVSVGDAVKVAGSVTEYTPGGASTRNQSLTELTSAEVTVQSSDNALPAARIIGESGVLPPADSIANAITFFEALEGMRVTVEGPKAIGATNKFGEVFTLAKGADESGLSARGSQAIKDGDFNPEKVQLQFGAITGGADSVQANVGATFRDVTGVIDYAYGNYEVRVTDATVSYQDNALPKPVTTVEGGAGRMTVASYNVLNLDPNDADGDADVADGRFDAIAKQIVDNLKSPDVVALQEVQDNSGSADDGAVSASQTLQKLADAIRAAGGPRYEAIDNSFIGDNSSGGQPGGNIRTAFLWNPERAQLVEGSVRTIGGQGEGEAFNGARLPLVAKFAFNGEELTVVNNHFSSKGGSAAILGTEQPFEARQEDVSVNGSLDERQAQSDAVKGFVDALFAQDANAHVAVMGDFNEFQFVSPVKQLAQSLTNLTETLPETERYSYNFQGNAQSLDHILVSAKLAADAQFEAMHLNSDYAYSKAAASDHDPLVASFQLGAGPLIIAGTDGNDRLVGTDADEILQPGAGRNQLKGGGGADVFAFDASLSNGAREVNLIHDYNAEEGDVLGFSEAAVNSYREAGRNTFLFVGEDSDQIILRGVSDYDSLVFQSDLVA